MQLWEKGCLTFFSSYHSPSENQDDSDLVGDALGLHFSVGDGEKCLPLPLLISPFKSHSQCLFFIFIFKRGRRITRLHIICSSTFSKCVLCSLELIKDNRPGLQINYHCILDGDCHVTPMMQNQDNLMGINME